jgi:hypothetical protein
MADEVPVLDSITPTSLPVGPPEDTVLHCHGSGFVEASQIRFGEELERTDFVDETEVTTVITAGLFPSPDANVPVTVYTEDVGESDAQTFVFADEGGGKMMRIVDQPFIAGLIVDDGTNVVHVTTDPTEVPPESVDAVHAAASVAGVKLVEEGEEEEVST